MFEPAFSLTLPAAATGLVAADLNADGKIDLIASTAMGISIFFGRRSWSTNAQPATSGSRVAALRRRAEDSYAGQFAGRGA